MKIGKVEKYINEEVEKHGSMLLPLIDPCDYPSPEDAIKTGKGIGEGGAGLILVGGSIGAQGALLDDVVKGVKEETGALILLFPGNIASVTKYADALYFMSLVNSRNPYWIIQAQAAASFQIKSLKLEPLPVAYMVTQPGGTVGWVGDANLIPVNKPSIAAGIALAAQYLGARFIITDRGAGAEGPLPAEFIAKVAKSIDVTYIAGGGIKTPEQAEEIAKAGAHAMQIGSIYEKTPIDKIPELTRQLIKRIREGAKNR